MHHYPMVHPYQPYGGVLPIPFHLVQNGMAYFNYYPSIAGSKSYPQLSHVSPYSSGPSDSYTWVGLLNDAINNKKPELQDECCCFRFLSRDGVDIHHSLKTLGSHDLLVTR
ncbi:hypothetical protein AAHE18_06G048700 [Arachis hypogaea]